MSQKAEELVRNVTTVSTLPTIYLRLSSLVNILLQEMDYCPKVNFPSQVVHCLLMLQLPILDMLIEIPE